jgi:uncharacterized membrane protein
VKPRLWLWSAIAAWATGFAVLSILRHRAFETGRFDLGNMTQAVWSTAHGHFLQVTNLEGHQVSRLGSHFDPILATLAPFWLAWPSPESLLVVQAASIALGALPVFRLARRRLDSDRAALGLALAYLLYPATQWLTLNELHAIAFATPLLLFAFDYLDQDRLVPFALCAALAIACKEEIGAVVAGFGIWYALGRGRRFEGLVVAALGLAASIVAVTIVIPHFHGGESPFGSRYRHAGVVDLFTARNAGYLAELLVPVAAVPLLAPLALVAALPEAGLNLLSRDQFQSSIRFHYTAGLIPPLVLATVLGCERLVRRGPAFREAVAPVALVLGAVASASIGAVRVHGVEASPHDHAAERALRLVPSDAVVSATNTLGAHLSARRRILSFPVLHGAAWIAVDTTRLSYLDRSSGGARARAAYRRLRRDRNWRAVLDRSGIVVLRRRSPPTAVARAPAAGGRPRAASPHARSVPRLAG